MPPNSYPEGCRVQELHQQMAVLYKLWAYIAAVMGHWAALQTKPVVWIWSGLHLYNGIRLLLLENPPAPPAHTHTWISIYVDIYSHYMLPFCLNSFFFLLRLFLICMDRCDTGDSDKEMIHSATSLSPKHDRVQRQCQQMAVLHKHWAYQTHGSQPWSTNSSRDLTLVRCPLLS